MRHYVLTLALACAGCAGGAPPTARVIPAAVRTAPAIRYTKPDGWKFSPGEEVDIEGEVAASDTSWKPEIFLIRVASDQKVNRVSTSVAEKLRETDSQYIYIFSAKVRMPRQPGIYYLRTSVSERFADSDAEGRPQAESHTEIKRIEVKAR
jgi:hypothetical protein